MTVTTAQIKELREATGVSMMQCKSALEEAGGDMDKARIILQKLSSKAASKKLIEIWVLEQFLLMFTEEEMLELL